MVASSRGNNSNARAEQIYTLVAALQALRSAPELIFLRHQLTTAAASAATATATATATTHSTLPHALSTSTLPSPHLSLPHRTRAPATVAVDADILCDVFAAQLMAHRSTESLSTQTAATQPDGTHPQHINSHTSSHTPANTSSHTHYVQRTRTNTHKHTRTPTL